MTTVIIFRSARKMIIKTVIIFIVLLKFGDIKAQQEYKISGIILDDNSLALGFATVALYNQQD